jgi:hypothetical protein
MPPVKLPTQAVSVGDPMLAGAAIVPCAVGAQVCANAAPGANTTAPIMPPPTAMLAAASDEVVSSANRVRIDFDGNMSSPQNITAQPTTNSCMTAWPADLRHARQR